MHAIIKCSHSKERNNTYTKIDGEQGLCRRTLRGVVLSEIASVQVNCLSKTWKEEGGRIIILSHLQEFVLPREEAFVGSSQVRGIKATLLPNTQHSGNVL